MVHACSKPTLLPSLPCCAAMLTLVQLREERNDAKSEDPPAFEQNRNNCNRLEPDEKALKEVLSAMQPTKYRCIRRKGRRVGYKPTFPESMPIPAREKKLL
jgi:hypothetical protein